MGWEGDGEEVEEVWGGIVVKVFTHKLLTTEFKCVSIKVSP